jgi:hypothetical protein
MLTVAVVGFPFLVALHRWYGDIPERSSTPSDTDLGRRETADLGRREPDGDDGDDAEDTDEFEVPELGRRFRRGLEPLRCCMECNSSLQAKYR